MLINSLCETLGVTKTKLSRLLKHLVYDGVYADNEERVSGYAAHSSRIFHKL